MVRDENFPFKDHAAWFMQRSTLPLREADPRCLEEFWARSQKQETSPPLLEWKCAGPNNIAGRVTALIAHPHDWKRLYAGTAAGGVWRTTNGGRKWVSCWPQWVSANIGALAFDPKDADTIYCATGEANVSPDAYPGSGIYKSKDGGDHWDLLAGAEANRLPRRIGALYPDPHKPGRIFVGGINLEENQVAGLYVSEDGGVTWQREDFFSRNNYWCQALVTHADGTVFAGLSLGGAQSGIWAKDARGWRHLENGLPSGDQMGRISLAIANQNPDLIYALVGENRGRKVLGVYRTRTAGVKWEPIGGLEFIKERQSRYNNTIAVHPDEPETVVCGVTDVHVSRDAGETWTHASDWRANPRNRKYVHADQHALAIPGGKLLYAGTDGGVYFSKDMGGSWKCLPRDMCSVMFYDVDVAPTDGRLMCGGTQDNGTLLTGAGGKPGDWSFVRTGDGAWTAFDPTDKSHVFTSTSAIHVLRHTDKRAWGPKSWVEKTPEKLRQTEHRQVAIAVMAIDPSRPKTLWLGSRRLWVTADDGETWVPSSPVFDGSAITAIEIPPAAPDQVWVGTRSGGIFRSLDRGHKWSGDLSGPEIPNRYISRIETHPQTALKAVVTVAGTGVVSRMVSPQTDVSTYGAPVSRNDQTPHVYYTEDGGVVWRPIDSPGMPDVAHNAAIFETHEPYRLFVANDCGVWMTWDMANWEDVSGALPTVVVSDLVYHHRDRALIAATHGRGIWRAKVPRAGQSGNSMR